MESDDIPVFADPAEAEWAAAQRTRVIHYLTTQNIEHGGVSISPRWCVAPCVAIWAVRSKTNPDRIGWWAISGDCPTDYITCTNERDDADVLTAFSRQWRAAARKMAEGAQLPGYTIGLAGREKELAPMLLDRAELLDEFAAEMRADDGDEE